MEISMVGVWGGCKTSMYATKLKEGKVEGEEGPSIEVGEVGLETGFIGCFITHKFVIG